jgi:hypothetical protein
MEDRPDRQIALERFARFLEGVSEILCVTT